MEKRFIEVPKTARYYLIGNTVNPKNIWIALHGYGQQAKYFVSKVKSLDNDENLIVVAEGLNRFYLEGYSGRVGANWMTSEDREKDIADNHRYLDLLMQSVLQNIQSETLTINIIAFSQGIATACRWMLDSPIEFSKAILWAGSIPPEIDYVKNRKFFNSMNLTYVFGEQDEFFSPEKIKSNTDLLDGAKIDYQLVTFEGKHVMNEEVLRSLL